MSGYTKLDFKQYRQVLLARFSITLLRKFWKSIGLYPPTPPLRTPKFQASTFMFHRLKLSKNYSYQRTPYLQFCFILDYTPPLGDLEAFENEWMEIEIKPSDNNLADLSELSVPSFLRQSTELDFVDGPLYKQTHLEVDISQKSDRVEYGHCKYHRQMKPGYAFEIVVQWVTASGPIMYDLIYGWRRKATQCGFQLVSAPSDPLAEPFTEKSDPLRGPIFVPLNTGCLEKDGTSMFKGRKFHKHNEEIEKHFFSCLLQNSKKNHGQNVCFYSKKPF